MDATDEKWLTIPGAARMLGVGQSSIRTLVHRKLITCRIVPGSYPRVLAEDVERVARESTTPARPA